jgi:hypothetical protein
MSKSDDMEIDINRCLEMQSSATTSTAMDDVATSSTVLIQRHDYPTQALATLAIKTIRMMLVMILVGNVKCCVSVIANRILTLIPIVRDLYPSSCTDEGCNDNYTDATKQQAQGILILTSIRHQLIYVSLKYNPSWYDI